jgi:hypothetical protein
VHLVVGEAKESRARGMDMHLPCMLMSFMTWARTPLFSYWGLDSGLGHPRAR